MQIQVSLHQVYFKDTPALGVQFSTGFSVPVQEKKSCQKVISRGERGNCCQCIFVCYLSSHNPLLPMESL